MTDYGHELAFGSFLSAQIATPESLAIRAARFDERNTYQYLAVRDQPGSMHPWVVAGQVMSVTARARVLLDELAASRPIPDICAGAATMDLLSGGRFELGLTAAAGQPDLDVIRAGIAGYWQGQPTGFLRDMPGQQPTPPVWVCGAAKDALAAAARSADGWAVSTSGRTAAELAAAAAELDARAAGLGRDPASIRRRLTVAGQLTARSGGFLHGPPQQWVDELAPLVLADGYSVLIVDPPDAERYGMMAFAAQVAPALRRIVHSQRAPAPTPAPRRDAQAASAGVPERAGRWDDAGGLPAAARPAAPPPARDRFTAMGVRNIRWLTSVHSHLRQELADIQHLAQQVAVSELTAAQARAALSRTAVRQARWDLGGFCAMYAREVHGHHDSEDSSLFPRIVRAAPGLGGVVGRLEAEHQVIADVLGRFDEALVTMIEEADAAPAGEVPPGAGLAAVRALAGELSGILLSHLAYEEDQLEGGLGLLSGST